MKKIDRRFRPLAARAVFESSKRIRIYGVEFEEEFLADLVASYLSDVGALRPPTLIDAYETYMREHPAASLKDFRRFTGHYFSRFATYAGDVDLYRLRRTHALSYRDALLEQGLSPNSVRRSIRAIKAIIGFSYGYYGIDRINPFSDIRIKGEGYVPMRFVQYSPDLLLRAKACLIANSTAYALVGLIQLNTGMRISEPALAKLDDLVLDHKIPHLWIRRNEVTNRKTASSVRAVPLLGVSLDAATELSARAQLAGSEWLVPQYGREGGNAACSLALNKLLKPLGMHSHMFRHAFMDRLRTAAPMDMHTADAILGHSKGSHYAHTGYGWIAKSLEYQQQLIAKVVI